jgi:hypothetical protein
VDWLGNMRFRARRAQLQRSMRPLRVVVPGVLGKHPAEVSLPEDQQTIGHLSPKRQHDAFGEAVRPRTAGRALDPVGARNSLTPADLLRSRRRQPGMIRRWRCA